MLFFQGFEYISCMRTCQKIKPAEGLSTFLCFFLSLSSPTVFNTYKAQLETVIIEEVEIEPTLWVGGKVPSLQHCFSPQYPNVPLLHFIPLKCNLFSKHLKNTLFFKFSPSYYYNCLYDSVLTSKFLNGIFLNLYPTYVHC